MTTRSIIFVAIFLFSISCNHQYVNIASEVSYEYIEMDSAIQPMPEIDQFIFPYKEALEEQMKEIVAYSLQPMEKKQPESELGNFLADATRYMASEYINEPVDIGMMNYGGIRLPALPEGNITLGHMYELMPFDNYVVVLSIDGETLYKAFEKIADYGGWPVSGASVVVHQESDALEVYIQGEPLNKNKTYNLAISDYIANGGDNMEMFTSLQQKNTGILLREAFIDYFNSYSVTHGGISSQIENRMIYVD